MKVTVNVEGVMVNAKRPEAALNGGPWPAAAARVRRRRRGAVGSPGWNGGAPDTTTTSRGPRGPGLVGLKKKWGQAGAEVQRHRGTAVQRHTRTKVSGDFREERSPVVASPENVIP